MFLMWKLLGSITICMCYETHSLTDIFETFKDKSLKTNKLDPVNSYSQSGLGWLAIAALKMTKINLELLIDLDMQLVVEEQIRRRIWNLVLRYVKAKNKSMKNCKQNKYSSCLTYLMI